MYILEDQTSLSIQVKNAGRRILVARGRRRIVFIVGASVVIGIVRVRMAVLWLLCLVVTVTSPSKCSWNSRLPRKSCGP